MIIPTTNCRVQGNLFPRAPRRPRRVLMKVVDAFYNGFVQLRCPRCGFDNDWAQFSTKREALSQPCPKCNQATHDVAVDSDP